MKCISFVPYYCCYLLWAFAVSFSLFFFCFSNLLLIISFSRLRFYDCLKSKTHFVNFIIQYLVLLIFHSFIQLHSALKVIFFFQSVASRVKLKSRMKTTCVVGFFYLNFWKSKIYRVEFRVEESECFRLAPR